MKNTKINDNLEKYLSQVDKNLKYMSISEKTDILSELKNSFYERLNNGQSSEYIISQMESPKDLAFSYMGDSIVKSKDFSFKNLFMAIGFYSYASLAWISLIPTLAILSISFFFSSGISVLAGVMGLFKGIIHIKPIDEMKFIFFGFELKGFLALIAGLILALLFFIIGILFWKSTITTIKFLQNKKWKLKYAK
ncbi:HAAS signaling domain-containing protein [Anaerococcus hydrogenalis]|uniref:DUF1700 domain-containing protein n=1 Tax=Anaerococcus hydrogenalis TaxID=33029 RepID=A0A2N6UK94_9FIRM|nr:DUF1700 domain-containing protein [Anaerococcus hydrogenalis]MBS5988624.1 DUF1700 domain-containing protein [Anaerococcus hydrogenalis]MDK7694139.1 DUF1700 domain-containing protein [Anaerococcus hydrogenalis]MDK7695917.1 DUF1700 domain-containing protein [Anaerococcus hydrogenalis]MDK7707166.1 DUF1700 domain-containing protein [Anaerococcus hydrogenalis]PMC82194.1 hypothetical protein CJ192_00215 [Anaerococcus hydrogenalis]